jgi:5-phospho-D-xylono-1,4-lactonase
VPIDIQTVTGPVPVESITIADAHAHVWIDPPVAAPSQLHLHNEVAIEAELRDFVAAGGTLLVDCQPGGTGRNAYHLKAFAENCGVLITATTGTHLQKYYEPQYFLWNLNAELAAAFFVQELTDRMYEAVDNDPPIRATTIKIGFDGNINGQARIHLEAAALASRQTGALILFHTEQGKNAELLPSFFTDRGVPTHRLYMCHMDKRPDYGLHHELLQAGVLLGYDTFARPKYEPEKNVWPLLHQMLSDGFGYGIALGLDLAQSALWKQYGGDPGLTMLPTQILARLQKEQVPSDVIHSLLGQAIAQRLVWRKD